MKSFHSKVGIERKILTSILWVGILPMAVALIVGYITARRSQSNAVQQTLLTAATKTAEGLVRETDSRLRMAGLLAQDSAVENLLKHPGELASLDTVNLQRGGDGPFASWLKWQALESEDGAPKISLYGPDRRLLWPMTGLNASETLPVPRVPGARPPVYDSPQYVDFSQDDDGRITGTIVAPVREEPTGALLGYIAIESGINSMLRYALGGSEFEEGEHQLGDAYQLATIFPNDAIVATRLSLDKDTRELQLTWSPVHRSIEKELKARPESGSLHIANYRSAEDAKPEDVLLAFERLNGRGLENYTVYFVAYRPTSLVFSTINRVALLALLLCILFIAILCVNAYRDVHNNIVRPVSLLNEGAQIIRQGDFDLKLKIGTGDEIEELAQSFNKMAVALNRNIQKLEASEEKYRSLVNSMRDGVYQTDSEGDITFLNPAGVNILGFDNAEQAAGVNLRDMFIDPVDFDPASGSLDLPESEERSRMWMRRQDGRTVCVELTRNRMIDESGAAIGLEGIIRDVTKSVRLEQEARERSERISSINQIANVINSNLEAGRLYESLVVELHKLVDFDYASVALLGEAGITFDGRQLWPEEAVGPGYTFSLDGQHSFAAWVARERRCLLIDDLKGTPSPFAEQFPEFVRSCLCVPLYATGRIIGTLNLGATTPSTFTSAHVDTLEQMAPHLAVAIRNAQLLVNLQLSLEEVSRAREKLAEANDELKTLDEMKTNLLSNVSHELRTPLVSVMGYTDMILNGKAGPVNQTQQDYLSISLRNVEKLVTLIENLLDFSRLHRGDERLIFDTFDLVECAKSSIQVVKPLADSHGISIHLDAPDGPVVVEGDKGKLGQVFNNLLSNAVKFNKPAGRVDVKLNASPRDVEITVSDTGIGIPEEALSKIFTRFYQYDASSTRKYGGTGIGLAIVQDIVRLHGSTITVHSEPGEGSTFRFSLALAEPREVEPVVAQDTHILVELITRDRALSNQVRHFLHTENMDMIHATSLERASSLLERHSPDVIMLDVTGPDEGEDSLNALLENPRAESVPILLVTNDDTLYRRHHTAVAARIKSSFRKSTLLSGIHNALNRGVAPESTIGDKVLCVDDDPEILTFMRRCLEAEGCEVELCSSGEQGLKRALTRQFGLVLLDIAMPGLDGWEVCRHIKAEPSLRGIKVYMVTAKPVDRNLSLMRECGADGFLLKPFRPEDLVQLVQGLEIRTAAK